ncbi:AMP-binding protein [Ralstonia sp. 22111]|uniref:AMP-binding protein n=1 Tax=Ralstonia sp. 22111 TaxID=3453878 RepID=UPI003F83A5F8
MSEATPDTTLEANLPNRVTLGDTLHRSARKFGAKVALVDGPRRMTHAELNADSNRYAHALLASGLMPGDKVAMLCGNSAQFLVAAYGILKAGLVWVPINAMLGPDDVRYILEHAEARHVVIDAALYPALRDTLNALGLPAHQCFGEPVADGPQTVEQALQGHADTLPDVVIDDRDLALIMYTSGTTGRPKGAMHSHRSVHAALMSNIAGLNLNETDVFSCLLPMFHCAQFATAASAMMVGATLVIQRGFDPAALLDAIAGERITQLFGLPLMYAALLHHPLRAQRDISSLRLCLYAMAPMAKPLLERLIAEVCPNFALGSGQTEIFPMTMYFAPDQQLQRTGNYWGQPCMVNEAAVMDDQGNLLGPNQLGEIVHRGPNVMLGYFKDPQATANARRFGWHHTGDLGMWDADGQLQFKDRIKDMIKTGGENVPSVKVEEVLLRHAAVANAAVVGLPHAHWVEAVAAFVCLKPDAHADAAALQAHCRAHLGSFEVPKHIAVVDKLPMTATGKIQKHVLRSANQTLFEGDAR